MTQYEFTAFYPQFTGFTPAVVLTTYIAQANARFSSFAPEDAEEARRLYTAHRLTLYARVALGGEPPTTASGGNIVGGEVTGNEQSPQWGAATIDGAGATPTKAAIAAAGQYRQVASKKVGEVSVTYSSGTSSAISTQTDLADLTETSFGLQLLSLLKLYSLTRYVP